MLPHLTINTAHLRMSPRSEVGAPAIAALAPWTRSTPKATRLPGGIALAARAYVDAERGIAQLDIWSGPLDQAYIAVLVSTAQAEAFVWPRIIDQTRQLGIIAGQLRKPASLPWLASTLLPPAIALPQDTIMALADLARCWAWATLDAPR